MIVVSDTTTLSNLIHLNKLELLEKLFKMVLIPEQVFTEINNWEVFKGKLEDILFIRVVVSNQKVLEVEMNPDLDKGEKAAIGYAYCNKADLLIIDELNGRKAATSLGLAIIGTVGILLAGKKKGLLLDVKSCLDELRNNQFWMSDSFYKDTLKQANEF